MYWKISEKKLAIGIILLVTGILLLTNAPIINTPVQLSEKGLLFALLAIGSIILSIVFIRKSIDRA